MKKERENDQLTMAEQLEKKMSEIAISKIQDHVDKVEAS